MSTLRQLAETAKQWNEDGNPMGDATDIYPGELFSDACTPAAILALFDTLDCLTVKVGALIATDKQLRKMLCLAKATMPYMDDGEASDSSEFPHIDYMRDSPTEIKAKLNQRLYNKAVQASLANIDNVISEIKQASLVADNQPQEECNDNDKLTSTDAPSTGD